MSIGPLPMVDDQDFAARLISDESSLRVSMKGTADLTVQKRLETFLDTVHNFATEHATTVVFVDLSQLEFMNSSCLKGVVTWVLAVQAAPLERKYRITFIADPAARWQHRTLQTLVGVAPGIVSVQE
jgi:hypothetical protein